MVKKFKRDSRIPTGIIGLDPLIEGGFKKKSISLVSGWPGAGKTIFAIQFLVYGMEKFDEATLYITFEERKEKLYEDMLSFGWDLAKYEKENKFFFLEYTPEQVKKLLIEGGGIVESLIDENKIKRIAIDSITSFSLLYKDELAKKESALALFELINKWECSALLTSQDRSPEDHTISAALEFEVDGIIILYYAKIKKKRVRAIEILKMRGTKHPTETFGFNITNNGIAITKEVIEFK